MQEQEGSSDGSWFLVLIDEPGTRFWVQIFWDPSKKTCFFLCFKTWSLCCVWSVCSDAIVCKASETLTKHFYVWRRSLSQSSRSELWWFLCRNMMECKFLYTPNLSVFSRRFFSLWLKVRKSFRSSDLLCFYCCFLKFCDQNMFDLTRK